MELLRVLMVCWIVVVITVIYPVKEVEAALPPVIEDVIMDTSDKVVGYAIMSRVGVRATNTTALAKAGQVWGCRAAVTGTKVLSGAAVAGGAIVGTGAAVAAGVTLPAWVPVVIAVGSVASLVGATVQIIDTIRGFGDGEEVPVNIGYQTNYDHSGVVWFSAYVISNAIISDSMSLPVTFAGPNGEVVTVKRSINDDMRLDIWLNGDKIGENSRGEYGYYNKVVCVYKDGKAYIATEGPNGMWYIMRVYNAQFGYRPVCWDTTYDQSTPIKIAQNKVVLNGSEYVNSDTSTSPKVPINDSETIKVNMPNLNMIREANPTWTETQVEEEAMSMILANPEYVIADNEFDIPDVGPISPGNEGIGDYLLGIWEQLGSIKDFINPASDKFFLTTAFVPPSGYFEGRISDLKMIIGIDDHEEPWISPGDWEVGESSENWMVTIGGDPTPIPEITFQLIPQKILDERDVIKNWMSAGMWIFTGFFLIRKASEVLGA